MPKIAKPIVIVLVPSFIIGIALLLYVVSTMLPKTYKPKVNPGPLLDASVNDILTTLKDRRHGDVILDAESIDQGEERFYAINPLEDFDCEEIDFTLFKTSAVALKTYENDLKQQRIARQAVKGERKFYISYAREDVCSGVFPTGEYVCHAEFLIDNVCISMMWIRRREELEKIQDKTIRQVSQFFRRVPSEKKVNFESGFYVELSGRGHVYRQKDNNEHRLYGDIKIDDKSVYFCSLTGTYNWQ